MNGHNGYKSLIYALRPLVVRYVLSRMALVMAILCLPSVCIVLWFQEWQYLGRFGVLILLLCLIGWLGRELPEPQRLMMSEGYAITALTFLLIPWLMAWALLPSGLNPLDCFFETLSAITTTGLTTVNDLAGMDQTFLFTRAFMQWYGGLGIVVLSVTLLMHRTLAAYQLLEVTEGRGFVSSAISYAKRILWVYLALSVIVVVLSGLAFGDFYQGLLHGFSAISTGGFGSRNDSLEALPPLGQVAVMTGGVLGALALALYLNLWRGRWNTLITDEELRLFLVLLVFYVAVLTLLAWQHSPEKAVQQGLIMGASALSGTGFANADVAQLSQAIKFVLIMAMMTGGCVGSTSGGLKVYRLLLLWRLLTTAIRKAASVPHAVVETHMQGKVLTAEQIQVAIIGGSLLLLLVSISWFVFLVEGYPPLDALFEVVSAVATVGLSSGVTSRELSTTLKVVLCIDMLAGRLEVLALVFLFYPGFFFGRRSLEP